jgi:hypothetical protein
MVPGLGGGLLLALPGLVPALALNWGASPAIVSEASEIYVFRRLRHHLLPQYLPPELLARFALLVVAWLALFVVAPASRQLLRIRGFATGSLAIALAGMVIAIATMNHPTVAARLMRFYWFRLADVAVPLSTAIAGACIASVSRRRWVWVTGWLGLCALLMAANHQEFVALNLQNHVPRADKPGKVSNYSDWRMATGWINENTPANAVFLTPRLAQTFKWYAERGEVVSWKDIPQDARAIVAWWRRLEHVHGERDWSGELVWHDSLTELPPERLRRLGGRYGAEYLLTESQPRLALPRLYQNNSYAVYRLD